MYKLGFLGFTMRRGNNHGITFLSCKRRVKYGSPRFLCSLSGFLSKEPNSFETHKFVLIVQSRFSTNSGSDKTSKSPLLMSFEPIVRPEVFLVIKNWFLMKLVVQPYLDNDFTIKEFIRGAKQALVMVSTYLAIGEFDCLKGLVTTEAIAEIKKNYSQMNVAERQELSIKYADILFSFPYQIGIMFDEKRHKRFCEITVVYHVLKGFDEITNMEKRLHEGAKDVTICNYRFIREYTKGVQGEWIVNRLSHFKMCHLEE